MSQKKSRINVIKCNILWTRKRDRFTQCLINWHCKHKYSSDTYGLVSSGSSALNMAIKTLYMEVFMWRWRCDLEGILETMLFPQNKNVKVIRLATSNTREVHSRKHCPRQKEWEYNSKLCHKNNSVVRQFLICCVGKWYKALKCLGFFFILKLVLDLSSILVSGSYLTNMSLAYVVKFSFNFSTCHFCIISRMKVTVILQIKKKIKGYLPTTWERQCY